MAPALDFPASPTVGQKYPAPPVVGVPVYSWDGEKWTTQGGAIGSTGGADDPPPMDGAAAAGVSTQWAREDHVHPSDTTKANDATVVKTVSQSLTAAQQTQARQNIGVPAANLIINGDFRVNQGGYVSAAVLNAGTYGHDQWKAGASGGDYSFTQLKSSTQITIASGKSLIQPIEDANVVGGSYILSWTGTAQARAGINTLTPSGAYAASPLLIAGQTAGTVMSIEFNNGTLGTVKLESGAIATPFIMRPYDQELVTCQRYLQKYTSVTPSGYQGAGGILYVPFPFNNPMRSAPTVFFSNFTYSNASGLISDVVSINHMRLRITITATALGYAITDIVLDARL